MEHLHRLFDSIQHRFFLFFAHGITKALTRELAREHENDASAQCGLGD